MMSSSPLGREEVTSAMIRSSPVPRCTWIVSSTQEPPIFLSATLVFVRCRVDGLQDLHVFFRQPVLARTGDNQIARQVHGDPGDRVLQSA